MFVLYIIYLMSHIGRNNVVATDHKNLYIVLSELLNNIWRFRFFDQNVSEQ